MWSWFLLPLPTITLVQIITQECVFQCTLPQSTWKFGHCYGGQNLEVWCLPCASSFSNNKGENQYWRWFCPTLWTIHGDTLTWWCPGRRPCSGTCVISLSHHPMSINMSSYTWSQFYHCTGQLGNSMGIWSSTLIHTHQPKGYVGVGSVMGFSGFGGFQWLLRITNGFNFTVICKTCGIHVKKSRNLCFAIRGLFAL